MMPIQYKGLLLFCLIGLSICYQDCYDRYDASNCNSFEKCCDFYDTCADDLDDCEIYMNGHCEFIKNQCSDCCIMTRDSHYCGTQQECDDARSAQTVAIVIISIYFGLIIAFCFYGAYVHHQTKILVEKIQKESREFDQKRQEEGGLVNRVMDVGQQIFSQVMK